jgi:hypothetical protein
MRPSGGQPPADPPAARGLAAFWSYFVCFSYYQFVMLFIIMVCLTVGLAYSFIIYHFKLMTPSKKVDSMIRGVLNE